MPSLGQFTRFADLPAELRLLIWELVPEPVRVIGLVPPAPAWYSRVLRRDDGSDCCAAYQFRYVAQPRNMAVFPPLHACRESRAAWLPRLFKPQRHQRSVLCCGRGREGASMTIQFDMPFISYESDMFAVFDAWRLGDFAGLPGYPSDSQLGCVDPFLCLDRTRIRHIALCEIPYDLDLAIRALDIRRLPQLERLSFLTLGPDVLNHPQSKLQDAAQRKMPFRLEMPAVDVQSLDCELTDIASDVISAIPFFNESRPRHAVTFSPVTRPLPRYTMLVRAWLWHACSSDWALDFDHSAIAEVRWQFLDYVFEGSDDAMCPLPFEICGPGGHERSALFEWQPEFGIGHKLLCERSWSESLTRAMGMAT